MLVRIVPAYIYRNDIQKYKILVCTNIFSITYTRPLTIIKKLET